MNESLASLPEFAAAHLRLSMISLLVGGLISVPLGVWVTRRTRWQAPVLTVASIAQTIPSLALLALMVPLLALLSGFTTDLLGIRVQSIGPLPALVALTLYSVLPILRNTVTGITGIDPALIEAARGVGMDDRQRLWRVELPLALPTIVAGVRTATVWVVGGATLGTPVGATSLGNLIFSGLQTRNFAAVLIGSVASAVLALVLDGLIRNVEIGLVRRQRVRVWISLSTIGVLGLYAAVGLFETSSRAKDEVVFGAKTFTEQYILAELMGQIVERETGRPSRVLSSLGSSVVFDALASGEIDAYVDYSGTIWANVLSREGLPPGRERVLRDVESELPRQHGVFMLGPLGFENTYALAMRGEDAQRLGVQSISDLARISRDLRIGGDYEFFARPEWKALEERYGLAFAKERSMDSSLMYTALEGGDVDVISAYSTDGRIAAFGLVLVRDDLAVIPPYDAVILVSRKLSETAPDVVSALSRLVGSIDASRMQRLNHAVDEGGASPAAVASELLAEIEGPREPHEQ